MAPEGPIVIIMAAGLGTRMKSDTAKVLHRVAGRPLVYWPVELARSIGARRIVVVLGHQIDAVRSALEQRFGEGAVSIVHQAVQRGTGDAVRQALPALAREPDSANVLILSGDVPLLQRETLERLAAGRAMHPLAVVAMRPPEPGGYGRMVRDEHGRLARIVEERDAAPEIKALREVNAGIYSIALGFLRDTIGQLRSENAQGELYLTDLVAQAASLAAVPMVEAPFDEVAGVNDRVELARIDALARRRVAERWMREGVSIEGPETVAIDADVASIGRDAQLGRGVSLRGQTVVGAGVRIDTGCVLTDVTVEDGAVIKPYCVLTEARIGARAQVGPFAHCRPGTELDADVHLGNFVETKKARLARGAKANHLSYLGDVDIGARVNVGAGTITCNYDGFAKHKTVIEEGAFIGSDTQLVAPVTVGKGAYVGAGTTVTKDVPAGALAITRAEQRHVEGYAERKAQNARKKQP